jgi:hypothetical protein
VPATDPEIALLTAVAYASVEHATVSPADLHPYLDKAYQTDSGMAERPGHPTKLTAGWLNGQAIRLSSDVFNPLSRSRNSWADGDGCVGAG